MSEDTLPHRPLWKAALFGAIPPTLFAWVSAVAIRQFMIRAMDEAHLFEGDGSMHRPAAMFTGGWFSDIGAMLLYFAAAFFSVALLLFVIMTVAERKQPQPPVAWLCAGVAATTPLVLYAVWPDASAVPTWQILMVYFVGIAAAWYTRRLRYGAWL